MGPFWQPRPCSGWVQVGAGGCSPTPGPEPQGEGIALGQVPGGQQCPRRHMALHILLQTAFFRLFPGLLCCPAVSSQLHLGQKEPPAPQPLLYGWSRVSPSVPWGPAVLVPAQQPGGCVLQGRGRTEGKLWAAPPSKEGRAQDHLQGADGTLSSKLLPGGPLCPGAAEPLTRARGVEAPGWARSSPGPAAGWGGCRAGLPLIPALLPTGSSPSIALFMWTAAGQVGSCRLPNMDKARGTALAAAQPGPARGLLRLLRGLARGHRPRADPPGKGRGRRAGKARAARP